MSTNFPSSLDVHNGSNGVGGDSVPASATALDSSVAHPTHANLHENTGDAIQAIEAKVGTGASTPAANKVLTSTGTGTSVWGTVSAAMIAASAVDTSQLAASAVETAKINDDAVTSAKMAATVAVDTAFSVGALTSGRILSTNSSGAVDFYRTTSTTTDGILVLRSNVSSTPSNKLLVYANGDVATATGTYGSISDARLKDVIGPSVDRLAQINDMEVIKYRLTKTIDDEGNIVDLDTPSDEMLGFSAQQLQAVAPGLVSEVEHGILNVKTSVIVPMLVKAVQELTARLEALETA
tara:strand:+ start:1961 stop:2845 length:885 start_codon:yes stop_codon:yes gene_type:complete